MNSLQNSHNELGRLLSNDGLTDEQLREAASNLLPQLHDALRPILEVKEAQEGPLPSWHELWAAVRLSAEDHLFFIENDDGRACPALLCNDVFAWASADCERIEWSDCPTLLQIYEEGGWPEVVEWIAARRGMEPQEPMKKLMEQARAERASAPPDSAEEPEQAGVG